jgi:uncharacterized RDD family membrane protein YckC
MTARAAGLARRYAAWSLDFAVLAVATMLATWSRMQAGVAALSVSFDALSNTLAAQVGALLTSGSDPAALATQLLADPGVRAGSEAVQSALFALVLPPLIAYAVLGLLYHVGGEASAWQGSPGKRALGLTVARADGRRATLWQLVVRYVAGALSWLTLNLGHALALVPPHRALHDLLSGTTVFQEPGETRLPVWARAWLALQGLVLAVATAWCVLRYLALLQAAL